MFQLNDQVFHWKVFNRTICVPKKYLKSEVENEIITYLSYQQQGCILYNLRIFVSCLLLFEIHKLHQIFNLEPKICLLKSSWEMVRRLSLLPKEYMYSIESLSF